MPPAPPCWAARWPRAALWSTPPAGTGTSWHCCGFIFSLCCVLQNSKIRKDEPQRTQRYTKENEMSAATSATRAVSANAISKAIVDAAMRVHSALGPGLLESAYRACLKHELERRGHSVRAEVPLPVIYEGVKL